MAIYDQLYIRVNGKPLAENTKLDLSLEGDMPEVMTIMQGFAGITPSPVVRRISGSNVVPIAGFEFDLEEMFLNHTEVEVAVQFGGSGKISSSKGYFVKAVKLSAGVGQTVGYDFEFVSKPTKFQ